MIKRTLATLALSAAVSLMAVAGAGAATIQNGNFDDGLNGWNEEHTSQSTWQAESGANCNNTGNCFRTVGWGDSQGLLKQTVALEAGQTHKLKLSLLAAGGFWTTPTVLNPDNTGTHGQEFRVDIMEPGADLWRLDEQGVLATVFKTENGGPDTPWHDIEFDLNPWAGQTILLRVRFIMGETYMNASVDNVAVESVIPGDRTAPVISGTRLSTHRFESAARGNSLAIARVKGSTLSYNLSEAATVGLALKKFSAATRSWVSVAGTSTLNGSAGANTAKLTGRLSSKKALSPGKYMVTLTPRDAAGNSGNTAELVVRILKPR